MVEVDIRACRLFCTKFNSEQLLSSTSLSFVIYRLILHHLQTCPLLFTKCATTHDHGVFRMRLDLYVFSDTLQILFFKRIKKIISKTLKKKSYFKFYWENDPLTFFIIYKLVRQHLQTCPSSSTDLSFVIYRLVFHHLQTYPSSSTDLSFIVYNLVFCRL